MTPLCSTQLSFIPEHINGYYIEPDENVWMHKRMDWIVNGLRIVYEEWGGSIRLLVELNEHDGPLYLSLSTNVETRSRSLGLGKLNKSKYY